MKWSLSEYNLIVYGRSDFEIFGDSAGTSRFDRTRLFEHTSNALKTDYQDNLAGLAELPALITAETRPRQETPTPAFLSSIDRIRLTRRDVSFRFNHLHKISSEEIFECGYFDIEGFEAHRTHWAIKEGNLIEGFFKLLQDSNKNDPPKFFSVEQWPLPVLSHIAVMMPFEREFDPVHEAIKRACMAQSLEARRVDEIYAPRRITDDVFSTIVQSRLVICDLTDRNANVLYETGLAHALDNEVIMITQHMDDIPFDLRQFRVLRYLPNQEGLLKLTEELQQMIRATLD